MSRLQLALNVDNLDDAIEFYRTFFNAEPAKRRAGYANFSIENPPLKLVLFEGAGTPGTINHLGVEVQSTKEVHAAIARLGEANLALDVEEEVECCFAVQDKVWVTSPEGSRWETYVVLADTAEDHQDGVAGCASGAVDVVLSSAPRK